MNYEILPNGNLQLNADEIDRSELKEVLDENGYYGGEIYIAEAFLNSLTFISPEAVGALTDAPILTDDADFSEEQLDKFVGPAPHPDANVWWFPSYAVQDPWEELVKNGFVIFTSADPTR